MLADRFDAAIERTRRRIQTVSYCLDLCQWCGNEDGIKHHAEVLDSEGKILETLVSHRRINCYDTDGVEKAA